MVVVDNHGVPLYPPIIRIQATGRAVEVATFNFSITIIIINVYDFRMPIMSMIAGVILYTAHDTVFERNLNITSMS